MKVLFDANVVLDILLKRPGFAESALAIAKTPEPWLSALSIANICYVVGRSKSDRIAVPLSYLLKKFRIGAIASCTLTRAVDLGFDDFEDAIQVACAEENSLSRLITRNLTDFRPTPTVAILSVKEFLQNIQP